MALLHEATIVPTKDQLVGPWLETRPWFDGETARGPVGSFRLDDPLGSVGMECFLFGSASGSTLFVPLTYRDAALAGGETGLIGTMEHSVLGTRYVYDACADPVFAATVLDTIRLGGREADLRVRRSDGSEVVRTATTTARGDGAASVPRHDVELPVSPVDLADRTVVAGVDFELVVLRRLGPAMAGPSLTATFEGGNDLTLAVVRPGT